MKLQANVDRIEGDKVVLVFSDKQQLIVAKDFFPVAPLEGQAVFLAISDSAEETQKQKNLAKNILEEILKQQNHEV